MQTAKVTFGYILSVLAASIAVLGGIAIAGYMAMMMIWFHVPSLSVLSLSVPVLLLVLGLAWVCNKTGKALRRSR
jgi:phosphate starvation-inducible membrane PsiE